MKILNLNEANDNCVEILIPIDSVDIIQSSIKTSKGDVIVRLKSGKYFFVKETIEQIKEMLK